MLRQERIALILLCFVAVIVFTTYFVMEAIGRGPFATPYGNRSAEGTLVTLEGRIDSVTLTKTGGHCILKIGEARIFLPGTIARQIKVIEGDRVRVFGVVQIYQEGKEILVNSPDDISIIP